MTNSKYYLKSLQNHFLIITTVCLMACSAPQLNQRMQSMQKKSAVQIASSSERLGTKWGDKIHSRVRSVSLSRASQKPFALQQLFYADKSYHGTSIKNLSLGSGAVEMSVTSNHRPLMLKRDHGNYYVAGKSGNAYQLVYKNNSRNKTYEIVTSVDGLDVLTGKSASRSASGYVLRPNGKIVISGFRQSDSSVASFIFSKPKQAYAARTKQGDILNTGVIGTAVYELVAPKRYINNNHTPEAFPADNGYAKPPQW